MSATRTLNLTAFALLGAIMLAGGPAFAQGAGGGSGGGGGGAGGGGELALVIDQPDTPNSTLPKPQRARALAGCSVRDMGRVDGNASACVAP